jgi:dimethylargininase
MMTRVIALTRAVPSSIAQCELTHLARSPIDFTRAAAQHHEYEATLEHLGCTIVRINAAPQMPDSVFIEDTAVVVDELAVITRPGAESRRGETVGVAEALKVFRDLAFIEEPGVLDGGDVLRVDGRLWVGLSSRTNEEGVAQLAQHLQPFGCLVKSIELRDCLHLKTAVTYAGDGVMLINPAWIDTAHFDGFDVIEVDPAEPFAANVLHVGATTLCAAAFPHTRERLESRGITTRAIDVSELAKAEGGLTCCSLLLR